MSAASLHDRVDTLFRALGAPAAPTGTLRAASPIDGAAIGGVAETTAAQAQDAIAAAHRAFRDWRLVPAPKRGELVRLFGDELRTHKQALGELVSIEAGKILQEGLGEVQEMIDICDFAVGLSRQLYGLTIATERPGHRMMETWHPLGVVGIISAFNFPVAVWAWNACLALVCGNSLVWKPSEKTPLTAAAAHLLFERAVQRFGDAPAGLSVVLQGGREIGEVLADDARVALVSATGSTRMGREVGPRVARRFGRSLLELGGNNGMVVTQAADLDLAVRAITFSAVGTAGQRCTSLRRLFVHTDRYDTLIARLTQLFGMVPVGDPLAAGTLVGPLIDRAAYDDMKRALDEAQAAGAKIHWAGRKFEDRFADAYYVAPALVEVARQGSFVLRETFAPILYVLRYTDLGDVIQQHNAVPQGLSSSIMTNDLREAELFLSAAGSDCGIANVNIGPSGAEIGGAFGGEKETGGGRESGSDAWRNYMRRATNTINYSRDLPLAQGIKFEI